jgi:hypothetical protein
VAGAAIISVLAAVVFVRPSPGPDFERPALVVSDPRISQPADILKFRGRYVATELYRNRLAIFDDLEPGEVEYFDPETIGKKFKSPHYMAVTPWDTLLVSNGWGDSIVELADLEGGGWNEFAGIGKKFRAPHGLCIDESGWIYVGDSLNSRLVRFRDMEGADWQVFADADRRVSYIRELACEHGAVWVSNSYENRPGLNPGEGGNVLKITDFESGKAEVVAAFPQTNITGMTPLGDTGVLVGQWGTARRLALVDTRQRTTSQFARLELGTPYGTYLDGDSILVTYIGRLSKDEHDKIGGLALYR